MRLAKDRETPLPLYIGLAVHIATRKKRLVTKLFDLGLSVLYDCVISVLTDLASGVCDCVDFDHTVQLTSKVIC